MNYTDKTAIQAYMTKTIDVSFDPALTMYISAMSRFADTFCSQTLVQDTATTRKYDGTGRVGLTIDDVHDITEVTVDGTVVTPLQYPPNQPRKNQLLLVQNYFSQGNQNVEVTGKFGRFTTLPDDLKFAVTVLVAGILNQVDKQTDGIKSEKVGEYQVTYTDGQRADYDRAMAILKSYRPIII